MQERMLALGQPCLRFIASEQQSRSFLGGKPFAASNIAWPNRDGKLLGFVAQFDLGEINQDNSINWLPDSGRLLFFCELYECVHELSDGFDHHNQSGWAVLYEDGHEALHEIVQPIDLQNDQIITSIKYLKAFPGTSYPSACSLFQSIYNSLPNRRRVLFETAGLTEEEDEDYEDFVKESYGEEPLHQVGGFPIPMQHDDMEDRCQGAIHGIHDQVTYSQQSVELRQGADDWRLLFQFDSDQDVGVSWADRGMIYFWIREDEAKKRDFSNCWVIVEPY